LESAAVTGATPFSGEVGGPGKGNHRALRRYLDV